MLTVCTWKWGTKFSARYVNVMRAMLQRHLHVEHEMVCVTDDPAGIDPSVRIVPLSPEWADSPRCRRRMQIFDRAFAAGIGTRILSIDLDMVIVDDITPLVQRSEPIVCAWIEYAGVCSGSMHLMNAGALHGLWERFSQDPSGYPLRAWPRGIGSDQAMLNFYVRKNQVPVAKWTKADGVITYFGSGYERFEHFGVGPTRPALPAGARVVVLGSDDMDVLERGAYSWVTEHWRAA